MTDVLQVSTKDHVARVTLNRPDKHNAVSMELFAGLGEAGAQLAADRDVRAVILCGAGGNFCSGIDTSVFAKAAETIDAPSMAAVEGSPANFFQRAAYVWREVPVPVICAIEGVAFGAGLQIAMGADLRYARPDSRLSIMEIKWGLIPDMAISTTLRDVLPADKIKELTWSGRIVNGDEAAELGLVTAVHDDPLAAALATANDIARRSPDAIRSAKKLINRAWHLSEADALALEAELQLALMGSPNQLEAVTANMEQRAPVFED